MAVKHLGFSKEAPTKYIGLSSDTKPDSDAQYTIPEGSTFKELDTGNIYTWSGGSWLYASQDNANAQDTNALLAMILLELSEIRTRLEIVTA